MLFRKKPKRGIPPIHRERSPGDSAGLYLIEYDMMLKGSVNTRNGLPVRQFGVYVDGVIRLVTSGDRVDRETYEALQAVGAIRGGPEHATGLPVSGSDKKKPPLVEDSGAGWEY